MVTSNQQRMANCTSFKGDKRWERFPTIELAKIHETLSAISPQAITEFLKFYGTIKVTNGTYSHIIKGKQILYQLITGCTNGRIPGVSYSTYRRIYERVWRKSIKKINEWVEKWMKILSSQEIRFLYARIHNKSDFKHVTMFIDGKDFVRKLNDLRADKELSANQKSSLTSRKNDFQNGGKVVFLDDIKMMPVAISKIWM